jgi:fructokinase
MATIDVDEKSGWAAEGRDVPIDVGEVARLLEPWRAARPVTAASFLAGGLMNRNYRVRVGDDDVALRFYDRDPRSCRKETLLLSELEGHVAVPKVLHVAADADPVPFAVLEFVEGISMRDLKRTGDARSVAESAYAAGRELASLAAVRLRDAAIIAADFAPNPELLRGPNVNARLIDHFLDASLLRGRLGESYVERVHDFAWRNDDSLRAMEPVSTVAHGDFNSANILVRQTAGRWTVAAILDWEFAFGGSIVYDIGNFLRYERASSPRFEPSFSRGLIDGGVTLPDDWRIAARTADLSALCELLARPATPPHVAAEVRGLVLATVDEAPFTSGT